MKFQKNPGILAEYKTNVTQQTDNSDGGKTWSDLQLKCDLFAEYIVEKVLAHRVVNGKPLYLVQWRGYPNPVWNSELWESDLNVSLEKDFQLQRKDHYRTAKISWLLITANRRNLLYRDSLCGLQQNRLQNQLRSGAIRHLTMRKNTLSAPNLLQKKPRRK